MACDERWGVELCVVAWSSLFAEYGSTGKVADLARGQLKKENEYFPVSIRTCEFGPVGRVRPSRPASAYSFYTLTQHLVFTQGIAPDFAPGSIICTAIRHRVSPQFIGSRICVPMAFTA